ncbi:Scr1 family TA system antitoxin-like transcriptional regulator [Actinomadura sp. CNU-125]
MKEPEDLNTYSDAFDRLRAAALSPKDTRALIRSLAADTI